MNEQKILYVITKGTWGGAQRYVFELATAAKERGAEVAVAYGEGGLMVKKLTDAGIRTIKAGGLRRDVSGIGEIRALFSLVSLFRKEKPAIVHLNSSKAGFTGALAARIARVPRIVFTAHGWAFNEARPSWQRKLFHALHTSTVGLSHITICVSEAVLRDIDSPSVHRKLRVVHNGILCPALLPRETARANILPEKADAYWVGMLAELHKTKRVDLAIDSFAKTAATHPEAILVVFGEGDERRELESLIRAHDLSGRVFLRGFVEDASTQLSAFDMLLHPSRTEAFAYALLEASCASLPVIASNVGGIPEIMNEGSGILVASGDTDGFANAITRLIEHPQDAKAFGKALHDRVVSEFSRERMVNETFAAYLS